jgi:hypothetical protein
MTPWRKIARRNKLNRSQPRERSTERRFARQRADGRLRIFQHLGQTALLLDHRPCPLPSWPRGEGFERGATRHRNLWFHLGPVSPRCILDSLDFRRSLSKAHTDLLCTGLWLSPSTGSRKAGRRRNRANPVNSLRHRTLCGLPSTQNSIDRIGRTKLGVWETPPSWVACPFVPSLPVCF